MTRKADLEKEIDRLNEELSKRGEGRSKKSTFFILLNSNESTKNPTEVESSREYMKDITKHLGDNIDEVLEFRDGSHSFSKTYVQKVQTRFALEQSRGRRKKDGSYSEYAGQVHSHVLVTVNHKSNVTLNHEKMQELLQPKFEEYYGHKGFVGHPKWIPENKAEDYMTKSKEFSNGHTWKEI